MIARLIAKVRLAIAEEAAYREDQQRIARALARAQSIANHPAGKGR